jgi:hypothetical protein
MALGAKTKVTAYKVSNKRVAIYDIVMSTGANWTSAGESLTASDIGFRKIEEAMAASAPRPTAPCPFRSRTTSRTEARRVRAERHAGRGGRSAEGDGQHGPFGVHGPHQVLGVLDREPLGSARRCPVSSSIRACGTRRSGCRWWRWTRSATSSRCTATTSTRRSAS